MDDANGNMDIMINAICLHIPKKINFTRPETGALFVPSGDGK